MSTTTDPGTLSWTATCLMNASYVAQDRLADPGAPAGMLASSTAESALDMIDRLRESMETNTMSSLIDASAVQRSQAVSSAAALAGSDRAGELVDTAAGFGRGMTVLDPDRVERFVDVARDVSAELVERVRELTGV